jgi:hypothetical protein
MAMSRPSTISSLREGHFPHGGKNAGVDGLVQQALQDTV